MDLGTGPSPEPISHHNKPAENRTAGRNSKTEQRAAPRCRYSQSSAWDCLLMAMFQDCLSAFNY
eukprot:scaffold3974_cov140-Cylindrotheca_fusiformis.AAC.2